jgi:flagellar biosynthesis protein
MNDENQRPPPPRRAVALRYDGAGAPRVTAKGDGLIAGEIVRRAREHGIPLQEDAALVSLLARIDLGAEIPEALYRAVAQVLVFAYTLSGKKIPAVKKR